MFFLCTLLALAAVTAILFAAPLRCKAPSALAIVGAGALWGCTQAVATLAGVPERLLWLLPGTLFGGDSGSMDSLSALFVLIVSVGSLAATAYSRGYLARYLPLKSPAHISLHYTALVVLFYAMLGVVLSDGGYSFLFFWELMTVASSWDSCASKPSPARPRSARWPNTSARSPRCRCSPSSSPASA